MNKGKPGRGSDQFPLRLPDGMRDRIAASAERHGRSMNAEIIAALEVYFPAPFSLEKRVSELLILARALKELPSGPAIDALMAELEEAIEGIASGQAPELGEAVRDNISQELAEWRSHKAREYSSRVYKYLDEAGEPYQNYEFGEDKDQ